jgi:hypothetical protein
MKNIKHAYDPQNYKKSNANFWTSLLQWLRLLTLSLTRAREHLSGIFFHRRKVLPLANSVIKDSNNIKFKNLKK